MWTTTQRLSALNDGVQLHSIRGVAQRTLRTTAHFLALVFGLSWSQGGGAPQPSPRAASEPVPGGSGGLHEAWVRSRPGLVAVLVLTVMTNLLRIALPLFIFQVLDRVLASRSLDTLAVLAIFTVFAVAVGALADIVRRWMLVGRGDYIEVSFGRALFVAGLSRNTDSRTRQATAGPARALADLSALRQFVSSRRGACLAGRLVRPLLFADRLPHSSRSGRHRLCQHVPDAASRHSERTRHPRRSRLREKGKTGQQRLYRGG